MATVAEILKSKSDIHIHTVPPEATVYAAMQLMADKDIGAVLVQDAQGVAGIFTERDYARKMDLMGRSAADTPVHEVMTRAVLFVQPHDSCEACMQLMTTKRLRHLPVMQGQQVVGLLSMRDLVQHIISEQQCTIAQLEQYIHGPMGAVQ